MADCPEGFLAGATVAGIKPSGRPDLAVLLAPDGAAAAAMLTTNLVRAAPIDIVDEHLSRGDAQIRALLVNAGCANAATGDEGRRRADAIVAALARRLECRPEQILVASTGVIGQQLPHERIIDALPDLFADADAHGIGRVADAIMTTDTRRKVAESVRTVDGRSVRAVGIAKGAGMIHPRMRPASPHATMIAILLIDAIVDPPCLRRALAASCESSFHRITVDGDTSTNDCVVALASGRTAPIGEELLMEMLSEIAESLAEQIVRDGEGARRLLHVEVTGAATSADALLAARTVATSLLVRTAVAGGDPNWGRIAAAAGRSGATFDPARLAIVADGVPLMRDGAPLPLDAPTHATIFRGDHVRIELDLGAGSARDRFLTCDLTEEYIRINAEYTT